MLDELVGCGFNDQRVTEFAALDDRGRGRSRNDGVVVWAGNGLIDAALDEEARRDDVDRFAHGARSASTDQRRHRGERGGGECGRRGRGRSCLLTPQRKESALSWLIGQGAAPALGSPQCELS